MSIKKAIFTTDGKTIYQNGDELINEANNLGLTSEQQLNSYLHDCYIADESEFVGTFSEWLNWLFT